MNSRQIVKELVQQVLQKEAFDVGDIAYLGGNEVQIVTILPGGMRTVRDLGTGQDSTVSLDQLEDSDKIMANSDIKNYGV